jgi:ABC-type uncharacterized transport system fused permease/ATPase subunit
LLIIAEYPAKKIGLLKSVIKIIEVKNNEEINNKIATTNENLVAFFVFVFIFLLVLFIVLSFVLLLFLFLTIESIWYFSLLSYHI